MNGDVEADADASKDPAATARADRLWKERQQWLKSTSVRRWEASDIVGNGFDDAVFEDSRGNATMEHADPNYMRAQLKAGTTPASPCPALLSS
jgi:hypothetical protein